MSGGPRILLSAYQCGPGMGSVSQIGWEWYQRLSRRVPVTLVTHVRNRPALEAAGVDPSRDDVIFIDTEWFAGPVYRTARRIFPRSEHAVFFVSSSDFFAFDAAALRVLRERQAAGQQWDLVHVVTPVTLAAPTRLHRLGIPLVRGPLNSGLGNPAGFEEIARTEAVWLTPMREITRLIDAAVGSTRHSARLLVATQATENAVPLRYRERCSRMLENGIDIQRFTATPWPEPPGHNRPLRVLFVGRLIAAKGVSMLLRAVAGLRQRAAVELRIVGDGPMGDVWKEEAASLGLVEDCRFLGALPLDAVAEQMQWAHVLCLPSVRESGGGVLLEAMACGRPVIGVDFGGPAELIDEQVGALLPLTTPAILAADLEGTLAEIVRRPDLWRARGLAARERALAQFDWDSKIEAALQVYSDVLAAARA